MENSRRLGCYLAEHHMEIRDEDEGDGPGHNVSGDHCQRLGQPGEQRDQTPGDGRLANPTEAQ